MKEFKVRTPKTEGSHSSEPTAEQIEAFARKADSDSIDDVKKTLDPDSKVKFKTMNLKFNEFEYRQLEKLAKKHKRSMLSFIRFAISEQDKE